MNIPYDTFVGTFLSKITDFSFAEAIEPADKDELKEMVDDYFKRTLTLFQPHCKYDLHKARNDDERVLSLQISDSEADELVEIISEGMIVQWLKPYLYKQDLLENALNTRDFTVYSPAELLMRVGNAYSKAQKDFHRMVVDYGYNHGDLTRLHL